VDTKVIITEYEYRKYIAIGNKYIIQQSLKCIKIYDQSTFDVLKVDQCDLDFKTYHKKLDVLITKDLDYYRLNSQYGFDRIVLGYDYIGIRNLVLNPIMEIILSNSNELLFDDLAYDILFIDLYQNIINITTYNQIK